MRLLIEGWRFMPASYAAIARAQTLELLRRPGLELFFHEMPYLNPELSPLVGLLNAADEARLRAVPCLPAGQRVDRLLRIYSPYTFAPSPWADRVATFCTTEWGKVDRDALALMGVERLVDAPGLATAQVITCSEWSAMGLRASGASPEQVAIVPLGVDAQRYAPAPEAERSRLRSAWGWGETSRECFVFLHCGGLWRKGIGMLLQAFGQISAHYPQARLLLKGTDDLHTSRQVLGRLCEKLFRPADRDRVLSRLAYVGKSLGEADLVRLYQAADAYVSPYIAEGFNLPVLEAAACGLLVICTAGGPTDAFTRPEFALAIASQRQNQRLPVREEGDDPNNWVTILVPDLNDTVQQMARAIEQPQRAATARVAGPAFVHQHFTWGQSVDRLLAVLAA